VPSQWEVSLAGPAGAPIPLAAPVAVVSRWLDDPRPSRLQVASAQTGRSGHNDQARKWACGPLQTSSPVIPDGEATVVLGVRLLDDTLSDRLLAATRPGQNIRLGAHHYTIAGTARQIERIPWEDLRRWSGARAWQVRFVTPTCLRRGNQTSPWPAPESVARGLAERWRRLEPDTAPSLPRNGAGPVWVSDLEGRSDVQVLTRNIRRGGQWQLEDEIISGFTGRIRYVCDHGSDAEAADFDALIAFSAFAGVGSHTTYGFGVVAAERTWQPPTVRRGSS
jgi:CRISPR-associated endoribonuclease Cas6